jgi:hypothetical protein
MRITGIDHVQLAMPAGKEDIAREFYARNARHPRSPEAAGARQARWRMVRIRARSRFTSASRRTFAPRAKAHPALLVQDLATLVATLRSKGHEIVPADGVEGWYRVHVFDPFGNRIELMEPLD